jgi:hypothetical protein
MIPDNIKIDFDTIFKEAVLPFFKALSFKRKGMHFSSVTNDITQCVNVQKGKWSSYSGALYFTFNIGFYHEAIRRIAWPNEPIVYFPAVTDCFIQSRLGHFSHQRDHWYEVSNRIDIEKTKSQVTNDLETFLNPMLENFTSLDSLKLFHEDKARFIPYPANHIVFMMMTRQFEKGERLIKEHYQKAMTPQKAGNTTSPATVNHFYVNDIKRLADVYNILLP